MGGVGEEPFEGKLGVRHINRWMLGVTLLPVGVALLQLFLRSVHGFEGFEDIAALLAVSSIGALYVLQRRPAPVIIERSVRIEPGALRIGESAIPRAEIKGAQLVPAWDGRLFVRVSRRGRLAIDLGVKDRDEGRRLLRGLGFDASQMVAKFGGLSRLMAQAGFLSGGTLFLALAAVLVASGLLLESSPALWAEGIKVWVLVVVVTIAAMLLPSRIDVGADGVLVTWLGTKTFLPLAKIRSVEGATNHGFGSTRHVGARITMEGGKVVWLPVGNARWADERAGALVERIRQAMEMQARAGAGIEAASALLDRGARDVRDWIQQLRAIGSGANADLRTAPVNPEHLWRIVESHGAEPEERAAAAVALGASLDDSGKQRLRVAVEAVADERLRVAIGAAIEEDDVALEEALREVTEAPSSAKRA